MPSLKFTYKRLFIISALLLSLMGILFIYSAGTYWSSIHYEGQMPFYLKQLIYLILAIAVFITIANMPTFTMEKTWITLYVFSLILLVLVLVPGIGLVRNGSQSWIGLGPLTIQPAELAKITTLMYLSFLLGKVRNEERVVQVKHFLIIILPCALIMLQPDFGSVFILVVSAFILLFIARYPIKLYVGFIVIGVIGLIALIASAPYRLKRIEAFINPWADPLGSGFQAVQSLLAIGPAGLLGHGFQESRQKFLYLPEPQNDFIFSIILEEIGFLGGCVVLVLFGLFIYSGCGLALQSLKSSDFYAISALVGMVGFQACLNIGVVIGLIPVTGVTLPFISYGGTSLMIIWFVVAIVVGFANRTNSV
ncbi:cell division protein FtsW [Ureibacillus xyleni]|uniref:Cell division protein FtsW n=1 Tax=Ureibacillus xyleni TaxID=614648 RepID=A0A285RE65_9BACL|nr:putative peptidoglycan glycosyltransferase FtsW [Ureibacillus xyleni]SOB92415.1 cell division protein FtsW [Ureibacillus xyleni]